MASSLSLQHVIDDVPREADDAAASLITTPLWGIWEIWCDFPATGAAASGPGAASPSASPAPFRGGGATADGEATAGETSWLDTVKSFGVIDTVEGFWGIHDCVIPPSRMPLGCNLFLFRHNVAPLWEHEGNRRGGKWVCQLDRSDAVDDAWRDTCLLLIGEVPDVDETEVCGCVVSRRRHAYKISLWTRNSDDAAAQMALGHAFRRAIAGALGTAEMPQIVYISHCEPIAPSAAGPEATPAREERRALSSILYTI